MGLSKSVGDDYFQFGKALSFASFHIRCAAIANSRNLPLDGGVMIGIIERIYVAGDTACPQPASETHVWAVVHACKHPCHQRAVGYQGNLDKSHPNYLVLENDRDLFLNMIDPPAPLFRTELFNAALKFSARHWNAGCSVLFHCNEGRSRGPSLAMLFCAKVRSYCSNASYAAARRDFEVLYAHYRPGRGIERFLIEHWDKIGAS